MKIYIAIVLFNLLIGSFLGATGIGGFLIPIFLIGALQFTVAQSYSMSFLAFTVAGIIGAYFYWKSNNLDLRSAILLSIGSLPGAYLGVLINGVVSFTVATTVLYSFIIVSSIYSLLNNKRSHIYAKAKEDTEQLHAVYSATLFIVLGFSSAAFCTFAGAGGPVLVIPILLLMKFDVKKAIGIALFNSVFIGIPASIGYGISVGYQVSFYGIAGAIAIIIGVRFGTLFVNRLKQSLIKNGISIVALVASVFLLLR